MKRLLLLLLFATACQAQLWSGVINSNRAADWTGAGVVGGIPSASWTQCGSTIAAGASVATINTALAGCAGTNKYVLLGPGTFNLTGTIQFPTGGHVVLRGSGANSTFLVVPNTGMSACQLGTTAICIQSSDSTYGGNATFYGWTAGYAKGSNSMTVSSTTNLSASNPTILFLEQCETGFTAASPTAACTGTATDNNQLFVCSTLWNSTGPVGCDNNGPGNQSALRGHMEATTITNIAGLVLTIQDPLVWPDWSSGQRPRFWFVQPISTVGVENLAIDDTANGSNDLIQFYNAYNYWAKGCRFTNWGRWAVEQQQVTHGTITDNYFYHSTGSDSYAIRLSFGGRILMQNNIIQQVFAPVILDGASSDDVVAYNYQELASYPSDFMRGLGSPHAVNAYELYEGNVVNDMGSDGAHGTNDFNTRYRNFSLGWDSCGNGQCGTSVKGTQTDSIIDLYADRYMNHVANVLGTPGYHTTYIGQVSCFAAGYIYLAGCSNIMPTDVSVQTTAMYWDNYDVVTGGIRCNNSEVPTGISFYPNSLPTLGCAGGALPASFYLSSKPSWWSASIPFPAVGPDVTGGNIGQCSGTLNTAGHQSGMPSNSAAKCIGTSLTTPAWGGHVNAIPAMACFFSIGGLPDGTGSVLPFDANSCYSFGSTPVPSWTPPSFTYPNTQVNTTAQATLQLNNNGGATPVLNVNLSISGAGFTIVPGGTCGSTLGGGNNCTVLVNFSPTAVQSYSGTLTETDSTNHVSAAVSLSGAGVLPPIATFTPSPAAFGNQAQSTTSTALTITLSNTGGSPLILNSPWYTANTGSNPSDFAVVALATPTWTLVQHAENTCAVANGPATINCTATFASNITAGHKVLIAQAVASAGTTSPSAPVHNAASGDSDVWAACPESIVQAFNFQYRTSPVEFVNFGLNCDYVASATGGSKPVTSSWTQNGTAPFGFESDIEAWEFFPSSGNLAIDNGNTATNASCASTCSGPPLTITGTSDIVFTWAASGILFASINAPYTSTYLENNNVQGAFAYVLNQNSPVTTPVWTMTNVAGFTPGEAASILAFSATTVSNPCSNGQILQAGQTCNFQMTFTPANASAESATFNLSSNAPTPGTLSLTGTGTGTPQAAIPIFSPAGGTYTSTQTPSITSGTAGSTICYTVDGSTPTANTPGTCTNGTTLTNGNTITVSVSETVNAIATKVAFVNSGVATAVYVIQAQSQTAQTPVSSLAGGAWVGPQNPTVSSGTTASTVVYTLDGTTPTDNGSCVGTGSSATVATGSTVSITTSEVLKMYACKSGFLNSPVTTYSYALFTGVPIFSPASAIFYVTNSSATITITNATMSHMCLTTDLTTPTGSGGTCTHGTQINSGATQLVTVTVGAPTVTLFAISTDVNLQSSNVAGATFTLSTGTPWIGLLF